MNLTHAELKDAAKMIQTRQRGAEWVASRPYCSETVWCVELESNGLEVWVRYSRRWKTCEQFAIEDGLGDWPTISATPRAKRLIEKYGVSPLKPKQGLLADRVNPRFEKRA